MSRPLRLFYALSLAPELIALCSELQQQLIHDLNLSGQVRAIPGSNLHLTLRFMGAHPQERLEAFKEILSALPAPPIFLSADKIQAFPVGRTPRVLALSLSRESALLQLYAQLQKALNTLHIVPEKRSFQPHITLLRSKRGLGHIDRVTVQEFHLPALRSQSPSLNLYSSQLTSQGPIYRVQAQRPLP